MHVFFDENGNVTHTMNVSPFYAPDPNGPSFIETDMSEYDMGNLLDWRVVDGDLVRVSSHATINEERDRRLVAGSSFTVTGITDSIPLTGRPSDQTVYLALLMQAQSLKAALDVTTTITLRDGANVIHELTPDQVIELITQGQAWFESVMVTSWAMKDQTPPFEAGPPADVTDSAHWPL